MHETQIGIKRILAMKNRLGMAVVIVLLSIFLASCADGEEGGNTEITPDPTRIGGSPDVETVIAQVTAVDPVMGAMIESFAVEFSKLPGMENPSFNYFVPTSTLEAIQNGSDPGVSVADPAGKFVYSAPPGQWSTAIAPAGTLRIVPDPTAALEHWNSDLSFDVIRRAHDSRALWIGRPSPNVAILIEAGDKLYLIQGAVHGQTMGSPLFSNETMMYEITVNASTGQMDITGTASLAGVPPVLNLITFHTDGQINTVSSVTVSMAAPDGDTVNLITGGQTSFEQNTTFVGEPITDGSDADMGIDFFSNREVVPTVFGGQRLFN